MVNSESVLWTPSIKIITNVTVAENAVVTTSMPHNFENGEIVLINVPFVYGMYLTNYQTKITVLTSVTFQTEINTLSQRIFSTPPLLVYTPAQVAPITGNPTFYNSTPGSPQ